MFAGKGPDLKPCPWCGKPPEVLRVDGTKGYQVRCQTPDCEMFPRTFTLASKALAFRLWNTRHGETDRAAFLDKALAIMNLSRVARVGRWLCWTNRKAVTGAELLEMLSAIAEKEPTP